MTRRILLWITIFSIVCCIAAPADTVPPIGVVRVSGDSNFPPYEFIDEHGNPAGFNVDIFRAVADVMGIESTISLGPWDVVRSNLENGSIDMLLGMFYSEEREKSVDFSQPHLTVTHSLFVRINSDITSLDDIPGKTVIVQKGDIMHDYLKENHVDANIYPVASQVEGLRLLASGKYDCFLGAKLQGLLTARKYKLNNIVTVGPPISPRKYCFAVKEGDRALLNTLNEGLAIINETGMYSTIYEKWFGVVEPERITLIRALKRSLAITLPIVLILAGFVLWSWSLRRQVRIHTEKLRVELSERLKAEQALEVSEDKYRLLFETSRDALGFATLDGIVLDVNNAWLELFGYSREEAVGQNVSLMIYNRPEGRLRFRNELATHDFVKDFEVTLRKKNDTPMTCLVTANVCRDSGGNIIYIQTNTRDITRQRQLERQFIQAQKMESIGRLAGGIAHDFNNLLTVIIGNAELAGDLLPPDHPLFAELDEIKRTGVRAADLVRQLLAFSRSQVSEPKVVNINALITDMERMFKRLIGENIVFDDVLDKNLWPVLIDVTQMQQVLTNLVVNARDAMPDGGHLMLATENTFIDEVKADTIDGLSHGEYVALTVRDTGMGIGKDIQEQIFEPFFTTKKDGMGTGLGLSTCYGIARQNNGSIVVESEPGHGSAFIVYLPRYTGERLPGKAPSSKPQSSHGSETILIVEDEDALRRMIVNILTPKGYTIIEAASGDDALAKQKNGTLSRIDLLLTDVVMPGIDGGSLSEVLKSHFPGLKTLFMSGYADDHLKGLDNNERHFAFIRKPFECEELAAKIRAMLDNNTVS